MTLERKTLNLRQGDWQYLDQQFTSKGISVSVLIRYLVSRYVDSLLANEITSADIMEEFEL